MYKRAKDFISELNSVPMLGKRAPAISNDDQSAEAGSEDEEDDAMWASFPEEGGNIMGDVSLVGLYPLYPLKGQPHEIYNIFVSVDP